MRNLKARIDKLYSGAISDVSSRIVVYKNNKPVKRVSHGTNKQKVIEIQVKL